MDFVVFSLGRTATQWLVHALNLHPEILCFHGVLPFGGDNGADLDGYFDKIRAIHWPMIEAIGLTSTLTQPIAVWKPGDKPFESIKHIGNVHGLDPRRWVQQRSAYAGDYCCIQMTRHPLERLASMRDRWALFEYAIRPRDYEARAARALTSLSEMGHPYEPDDLSDKMFACAAVHLFPHETEFLDLDSLPVLRMEDLSPGALDRLTRDLFGAPWPAADLERVTKIPPIDRRRIGGLTAKQAQFARRLIAHYRLADRYAALGYVV